MSGNLRQAKPIEILRNKKWVLYPSHSVAGKALGVKPHTVLARLNRGAPGYREPGETREQYERRVEVARAEHYAKIRERRVEEERRRSVKESAERGRALVRDAKASRDPLGRRLAELGVMYG